METNQKEKLLEIVHGWVQATDQKISIFLAFLGIVLTTGIKPLYELFNKAFYTMDNYKISFCMLSAFLLMILASILALWALKGRVTARISKNEKTLHRNSFLFFNDIACLDLNEFRKKINDMGNYEKELESQIHLSAKIASKKLKYFNLSVYSFLSSIGFLILAVMNYLYVLYS